MRNNSSHKPFVVRPPTGEDRVVEPGAATTSLPFATFALVFAGRGGATVTIHVDARPITCPPSGTETATRAPQTVNAPMTITPAQRLVLCALCEPLLANAGPRAAPATYAEIGSRLGRRPQYIRNVVKAIRESLSGHGVPALTADDDNAVHDDFRWALARWAVRSGVVDLVQITALLPGGEGRDGRR
ncbi:hypothetical protein [Herbidospora daliensis]|uniref:hypothetical protein n=1 Tax=Herbidospora daliensis TaxID=295585 RepID=UPI0018DDE7AD|nr:hypothetical protein [Herbidospora daliensis]